jgi:hypothetical protein
VHDASRKPQALARYWAIWFSLLLLAGTAPAQTCLSTADIEPSALGTLEATAKRYFQMSANGDTGALKQNSILSLASGFAGIESAVKDNLPNFSGAQASARPPFILTADGPEPLARAEFLCGVFGKTGQTTNSAVFVLPNLPPGKYAVTILDISGGKTPITLTMILQQIGADWKLAGYFVRATQAAGHDGSWFTQRARDFKSKSQTRNAWLYYREAIALSAPVDFMSTLATDRLYDEAQAVQPGDLPVNEAVDLSAGGKINRWTGIYLMAVEADLDVVVRYESADISNAQKTYEQNGQIVKAVVAKFPELRDGFAGVVARAVEPSGRDYGTLVPMKDIK